MPKKKITKKELSISVKGMHDTEEPKYFAYQGLFEKASEIALYYGFKPIELPILEKEMLYTACVGVGTNTVDKELCSFRIRNDRVALRPEGPPGVMRAYLEHKMQSRPQPTMLYYYGSFFKDKNLENGTNKESKRFGLEILGTSKSIADATVIKVATTILKEAGFKDLCVQINSIGDKESRGVYIKELVSYYRKNLADLCATCRERIKTNPLQLLACKNDKCQSAKTNAPDSISFLSTPSKKHFREVLEYLDAMNIPYEIDSSLVQESNYYNQTVFKIIELPKEEEKETIECKDDDKDNKEDKGDKEDEKEEKGDDKDDKDDKKDKDNGKAGESMPTVLAQGGRYDYLAKQLGYRKDAPSVGITIEVDHIINSPSHKPISPRIQKKPKVYFIQFGFEAKLKSLTVIETLRVAHVPITQSLAKDRLSAQLLVAERLNIPYTIILGQREALDNTVIIRNMKTHSQETLPIDKLSEYIKKKLK